MRSVTKASLTLFALLLCVAFVPPTGLYAISEVAFTDGNGRNTTIGNSFDSNTSTAQGVAQSGGDEIRRLALSEDGVLLTDPDVWDSTYVDVGQNNPILIGELARTTAPVHVGGLLIGACNQAAGAEGARFEIIDSSGGIGTNTQATRRASVNVSTSAVNTVTCQEGRFVPIPLRLTTGLSITLTTGTIGRYTLFYRHTKNTK